MSPPPQAPDNDGLQVVSIDSLTAALEKLNVNVPVKDMVSAIREVDQAKRAKLANEATERRAALSTRKLLATTARPFPFNQPNILVALHPSEPSPGLQFETTSHFVPHPPKPAKADPLAKQRRRRLLELTKQTFPTGKLPDPFTLA